MKNKKKNKYFKMQSKHIVEEKGTVEEFLYMVPELVTVRELERALLDYPEDKKEIWVELDMMEVILENDSLVFENMMDTFDVESDQQFLTDKNIKVVYAFNYNTKDKEEVKKVIQALYNAFGGFIASDTEDFEPTYEVDAFFI